MVVVWLSCTGLETCLGDGVGGLMGVLSAPRLLLVAMRPMTWQNGWVEYESGCCFCCHDVAKTWQKWARGSV
jgi:hypothetical protein